MTTPETIIREVANAYGLSAADISSRKRTARYADARAVVCYLLYRHYTMTLMEVGDLIKHNHTSVLHNIRKVRAMLDVPKMYAFDIATIMKIEDKYFNN